MLAIIKFIVLVIVFSWLMFFEANILNGTFDTEMTSQTILDLKFYLR